MEGPLEDSHCNESAMKDKSLLLWKKPDFFESKSIHNGDCLQYVELLDYVLQLYDQSSMNKVFSNEQCQNRGSEYADGCRRCHHENNLPIVFSNTDQFVDLYQIPEIRKFMDSIADYETEPDKVHAEECIKERGNATTEIKTNNLAGHNTMHSPIVKENRKDDFNLTSSICRSKVANDFDGEYDGSKDIAEYPNRIRRSKYCDINGDLSHIRREPRCSKRREENRDQTDDIDRKRMKKKEDSAKEETRNGMKQKSSFKDSEVLDYILIRELRKYLLNKNSEEHQNLALAILGTDENLMRIFLEEMIENI